jgi:hypothetical protein
MPGGSGASCSPRSAASSTEADQAAVPYRPEYVDAERLGAELARAYGRMVAYYRREVGMSAQEADAAARSSDGTEWAEANAAGPPDQVSWWALSTLTEQHPEKVAAAWGRIVDAARDELYSGNRAADAVQCNADPFERARFLALREGFREGWQPRGGVEEALVDQLAIAHSQFLFWSERLTSHATNEARAEDAKIAKDGYWVPPRLTVAQWTEQAAQMADRYHRIFQRTLRNLRDLRRYTPQIVVNRVDQLNVGQQQVNVAAPTEGSR